ncbi:MAG: glycoside hydrolase domain-containing protein [Planctomycetota bacterium]
MKSSFCAAVVGFGLAFALCCALHGQGIGNELANPGFEESEGDQLKTWQPYHKGYAIDRTVFHTGRQSIRCTSDGEKDGAGVMQVITYEKPDKRPVIIGGWCKTENVSGGGDCSVYLDIHYDDGTPLWGKTSTWGRGTHDWEYSAQIHWPAKPIKEIKAFVFLRRTAGVAWFDNVKVCRGGLHLTDICVASDYPRSRNGIRLTAKLTQKADWSCSLLDAAGTVLDAAVGSGSDLAWFWPGREGALPKTASLKAKTAKGEAVEFDANVSLPPREKNPVREGYAVWTQSSMKQVYPTDPPPETPSPARLDLARGEREGIQIAIKPADNAPLKDAQLKVGKFANENGDVFPPELIRWHVIGYVWVQEPSGHPSAPDAPNWCPDVLLPPKPVDVPHGRTQTLWLDVFASEAVKPGTYRSAVTVQPSNAKPTDVPVEIRVRRFALPRAFGMKTAFAIMDGFTKQTYGEITPELRRKCLDIMLDHRLNPDDISRIEPPRIEDLLYARERGMNTFNILNLVPKPKGDPSWVCYAPLSAYGPDFNKELADRLDGYIAELRKHGLSKIAYFYGFDERGEDYDETIKGICKFLKERYPEVSTFTTAGYMYHKRGKMPADYQDYMDWYCPLTPRYDPSLFDKLRALGKQVWWYVCCGPKYPYANFASMDYPAIEGRLLAWMTWGYKADGLLFWHVNLWNKNKIIEGSDPYLVDWKSSCVARMTGDGILAYPTPDGPVSSIRLENIRDGIEDYDCLSILADLKGREAAMRYFDRLVKSMTEYSRDPAELYAARAAMADEIEAAVPNR